uniref:Uncharacterized protein n=1 Tax=Rhizophora mucronata TaxID=61149 RepID=A0A2P2QAF2_RHIMU
MHTCKRKINQGCLSLVLWKKRIERAFDGELCISW